MLFLLFTDEQLRAIFDRLGYELALDIRRRMFDYYDGRTSHGSPPSHVAHAGVLAAIDPERFKRFLIALESDIGDIQGGTTREGIQAGVASGTLDLGPARLSRHRDPRRCLCASIRGSRIVSTRCRCRCSSAAPRSA